MWSHEDPTSGELSHYLGTSLHLSFLFFFSILILCLFIHFLFWLKYSVCYFGYLAIMIDEFCYISFVLLAPNDLFWYVYI